VDVTSIHAVCIGGQHEFENSFEIHRFHTRNLDHGRRKRERRMRGILRSRRLHRYQEHLWSHHHFPLARPRVLQWWLCRPDKWRVRANHYFAPRELSHFQRRLVDVTPISSCLVSSREEMMTLRSAIAVGFICVLVIASCGEVLAQAKNNMRDLRDVARPRSSSSSSSTSNSNSRTEAGTRNTSNQTPNDYLDRNKVGDTLRRPW
jgi:hypothetical protein